MRRLLDRGGRIERRKNERERERERKNNRKREKESRIGRERERACEDRFQKMKLHCQRIARDMNEGESKEISRKEKTKGTW